VPAHGAGPGSVNAVALRSRVLHHVSASPGRKLHNEENTRRLVLRWREQIALIGSRRWTWRRYRRLFLGDPRDFPDPRRGLAAGPLPVAHVRRVPPAGAIAAMNGAIDGELARWRKLISD
jgi:hypothetical protein